MNQTEQRLEHEAASERGLMQAEFKRLADAEQRMANILPRIRRAINLAEEMRKQRNEAQAFIKQIVEGITELQALYGEDLGVYTAKVTVESLATGKTLSDDVVAAATHMDNMLVLIESLQPLTKDAANIVNPAPTTR